MKQFLKQFTESGIDATHKLTQTITHSIFRSARLQITFVYAATMMCVIVFFSVGLFQATSHNVRIARQPRPQVIIADPNSGITLNLPPEPLRPQIERQIRAQLIEDIKENLITLDAFLLVVVTLLGYVLAGFTLRPIEQAYEKQKKFVADASHDLRTPLAIMQSELELALRHNKQEQRAVIESSLEEVNNLSALVDNLLFLARIDQTEPVVSQSIDIGVLLEKVIHQYKKLAAEKKLTLEDSICHTTLFGNPHQIERALRNVLVNAIEYTDSGNVKVVSEIIEKKYVIRVVDTGRGIRSSDLPHVFDRFYRGDSSRTDTSNSGLGLSIVKEILEAHGGTIKIKSEEGKGTEVAISLPIKK